MSTDKLIVILDANGRIFYYKQNPSKRIYFNLPAGEYQTNNNLTRADKPRLFKPKTLPAPNRPTPMPQNFDVVYTVNPNKCSVDLETGKIYFDHSFKNKPEVITDFILAHEIGHYSYSDQGDKSEILCDLFSYNTLIDLGYNPSQIKFAQKSSLSKSYRSTKRKKALDEAIKQTF